jgi:hypothetical protein
LAVTTSVNIDGVAYPVQAGWWHCFYCGSLFSSPTAINNGVCPIGGAHSLTAGGGSGQYLVANSKPTRASPSPFHGEVQAGWRFCGGCRVLFWSNSAAEAGKCPSAQDSTGQHKAPSGSFVYDMIIPQCNYSQPRQANWRLCFKCKSIFYSHGATTPDGNCVDKSDGKAEHEVQSNSSNYEVMTA